MRGDQKSVEQMRRMVPSERDMPAWWLHNGEKDEDGIFIKQRNSFTNPAQSPMIKTKNTKVMEKGKML